MVAATSSPSTMALNQLRLLASRGGAANARRTFHASVRRWGAEKSAETAEIKGVPYSNLRIGVPKESMAKERRVAVSPAVTATLVKKGFTVSVEDNAGQEASFRNQDYEAAGAKVVPKKEAWEAGEDSLSLVTPPFCSLRLFFQISFSSSVSPLWRRPSCSARTAPSTPSSTPSRTQS